MSIVLQSSGGGQITIQEPATASNFTQTLPAATGTVMVSGNMPAFSAYASANQTISQGVFTKVQYNVEEFDTNSNYDNTTNYRFTPTVAGYYQVTVAIAWASTANALVSIYKNGSEFKRGSYVGANIVGAINSALIYMNGTTDYLEGFCYQFQSATLNTSANSVGAYFQAAMVRSA